MTIRHEAIIRETSGDLFEAYCLTCQRSLGQGTWAEAKDIGGDHA